MQYTYFIPSKILFGKGQLANFHKEKMPGKKALIVLSGGTSVKKYGYLDKLLEELKKANIEYTLFDKILANPIKEHVMEAAKLAREQKCDFIIGLGGGSTLDSAKAIAVMAVNEGDLWDYTTGGTGKAKKFENKPLPMVAITTTAGTGTEADPWFVITKTETNEKIGMGFPETFPVLSVVDPELMLTVPPHLTAYQGFDALFHSTEGYINKLANPISDMYALKSIELLGKYLPRAVKNGQDIEARENVALANTLSGMVESTSCCTSEHSLEHALSAYHHELPHGAGLIILSKAYYTYFAGKNCCDERMVDMAKALGKKDATKPIDFVEALEELQKSCNVHNLKLSEYGVKKEDMRKYAINAKETMGGLFDLDPHPMSEDDAVYILEQSYR